MILGKMFHTAFIQIPGPKARSVLFTKRDLIYKMCTVFTTRGFYLGFHGPTFWRLIPEIYFKIR